MGAPYIGRRVSSGPAKLIVWEGDVLVNRDSFQDDASKAKVRDLKERDTRISQEDRPNSKTNPTQRSEDTRISANAPT